jgi:hypothetical protein
MGIFIGMKSFLILCISLLLVSCSTVRPTKQVDTSQNSIDKQTKKIDDAFDQIVKNESSKRIQSSVLSQGIQYSLLQVTNPPIQVETAKTLNERVISIVGTPHIDEIKRIKVTVDLLNSQLEEERKKGLSLLSQRDDAIIKLQRQKEDLKTLYDDELWKMTKEAERVAKESDAKQATLDSMGGMFGLNAVIWGLKRFFFSALTFIVIFGVIFLVLRILATVNPAAAAAFAIFNMIGSTILGLIKVLTPKAFEMANFTPSKETGMYKSTLMKIVDVIQDYKIEQKKNPNKPISIDVVLNTLKADMDQHEKDLIDDLLVDLNWKK